MSRLVPTSAAVVVVGVIYVVEALLASDDGKSRTFLVVSLLSSVGGSLSFGEDFLFLEGSLLSLSDSFFLESNSDSDEL